MNGGLSSVARPLFRFEPNLLRVIPIPIVIDEYLLAGLDETHGFHGNQLLIEIHFVLTVAAISVVVEGNIAQRHTTALAVIAPFEDIVVQ